MKTEKDFLDYLATIEKIAVEEGFDSLDETYTAHLRARFLGEDVIIGQSDRVRLREMKLSDVEEMYRFEDIFSESVLQVFLKSTVDETREYLKAYIEQMYPLYDYGFWVVELKETDEVIGLCGFGQIEVSEELCPDIGYYIRPKWRRHGFATECIEIALDYAKNYLELPELYAVTDASNHISQIILKKFGFSKLEEASCEDTMKFCLKLNS